MEPRGRLRPEVTQLWCWGPDGATTTEERLTIDDAAAVRDALRKEAGGERDFPLDQCLALRSVILDWCVQPAAAEKDSGWLETEDGPFYRPPR